MTNLMYNASASISQDGSRIYRGDNGGIFYAFNSTGSVACQYDTGGGGIFCAPALSANDVVYFTQAASFPGECGGPPCSLFALRASDCVVLDAYPIGSSQASPAIASDGTVYALGSDSNGLGLLYAFPP